MPFHTLRRLGVRISSAVRCLFGRVESPEERYRDFNGRYFSGFYEQERMLADKPRMEFYRAAIQRRIQPGDRVIDLGTGTGILAALASRRGAAGEAVGALTRLSDCARPRRAGSPQVPRAIRGS